MKLLGLHGLTQYIMNTTVTILYMWPIIKMDRCRYDSPDIESIYDQRLWHVYMAR